MTILEIAAEYRKSAEMIRGRLTELRKLERAETDDDIRCSLHRRILELRPLANDCAKIAKILEVYYANK